MRSNENGVAYFAPMANILLQWQIFCSNGKYFAPMANIIFFPK
jgi:hypothetical protein